MARPESVSSGYVSENPNKESRLATVFNSIRPYVEKIKDMAPLIKAGVIGLVGAEVIGFGFMTLSGMDNKTLFSLGFGVVGAFVGVIYKKERECDDFARQSMKEAKQAYAVAPAYQGDFIY